MANVLPQVKPNLLDRTIGYIAPERGARRLQARYAISCFGKTGNTSFEPLKDSPGNRKLKLVGGDGDSHLQHSDLWELRETSRLMDLNIGLTMSILDRVSENVVGPGGYEIKPQTKSKKINKRIKRDFSYWLEKNLDHRREFGGWPLIRRCYRSGLRDGDSWGEFRFEGDCSVMMFEGCRVLSPNMHRNPKVNGYPLKNGVAKDKDGRKAHLWIADESPSTPYVSEKEGRLYNAKNFIQFYNPKRLSLSRGIPVLAPVIREVNDIDDLLAFERTAAKKVASMNLIVKTSNPGSVASLALGQSQESTANSKKPLPQYLDPHRLN